MLVTKHQFKNSCLQFHYLKYELSWWELEWRGGLFSKIWTRGEGLGVKKVYTVWRIYETEIWIYWHGRGIKFLAKFRILTRGLCFLHGHKFTNWHGHFFRCTGTFLAKNDTVWHWHNFSYFDTGIFCVTRAQWRGIPAGKKKHSPYRVRCLSRGPMSIRRQ